MSCVYCGPHFSSKWEEELKLHGDISVFKKKKEKDKFATQNIQKNNFYEYQKKQLWKYLEENNRFKILRYFSFLGGEPLIIPELDECLDFWREHPNEKLTFQIITNLKVNDFRFDNFLSRIDNLIKEKKIYRFKIVASLDGIGPQSEYVRHGIDITQWTKNFEKLLKLKNVSVGINSTISVLTLHEFPFLLEKIIKWNKDRPVLDRIIHSFQTDTSSITDPYMAGPDIFKPVLQKCYELFTMKNLIELSAKKCFDGIAKQMENSIKSTEKIQLLKKYLSVLDIRRNTDWKKTFPWLINL